MVAEEQLKRQRENVQAILDREGLTKKYIPDFSVRLMDVWEGNPRLNVDEGALDELAGSIATVGVREPLLGFPVSERAKIIDGQRRLLACRKVERETAPLILVEGLAEEEKLILALSAAITQKKLSLVEEGYWMQDLKNRGYAPDQIARFMGCALPTVWERLAIMSLPEGILAALASGNLSRQEGLLLARCPRDLVGQMVQDLEGFRRRYLSEGGRRPNAKRVEQEAIRELAPQGRQLQSVQQAAGLVAQPRRVVSTPQEALFRELRSALGRLGDCLDDLAKLGNEQLGPEAIEELIRERRFSPNLLATLYSEADEATGLLENFISRLERLGHKDFISRLQKAAAASKKK